MTSTSAAPRSPVDRCRALAGRVPELHCPFAGAIHEDDDAVNAATLAWAREVGLVDAQRAGRLAASKIGSLVARAYPRGAREPLQLAADWTTLFCLLDDWIERLESTAAVARTLAAVHAALCHGVPANAASPLERAAADVGARFARLASPAQRRRFDARASQLFQAFAHESEVRASGRPAPMRAYLPLREVTVGLYVEMEIGEIVDGIELSADARAAAERVGLLRSTSNLVGWANDIHTYEKEVREGEPNNLIAVMVAEGMDLGSAVARAVAMHDAEARSFAARAAEVGSDPELRRYADTLRAWVRGHLDWSRETGRYRPAGSEAS
jgi:hypothetical protein